MSTPSPDRPLSEAVVLARGLTTWGSSHLLTGISLDVAPGEIVSIVGDEASGKSQLLDALVGLRACTADTLLVCGLDPRVDPIGVNRRIGAVPRRIGVEHKLTVGETLDLYAAFHERAEPDRLMARLDLDAVRGTLVEKLPPHLSQRVFLAVALLHDPDVFFADEPTRDLDPRGKRLVWEILADRRQRGRTSVISTNHLDDAARVSDRIGVMHDGHLVAADTPAALAAAVSLQVFDEAVFFALTEAAAHGQAGEPRE
jgi:ABC-2 type transport system ATP-binding protein